MERNKFSRIALWDRESVNKHEYVGEVHQSSVVAKPAQHPTGPVQQSAGVLAALLPRESAVCGEPELSQHEQCRRRVDELGDAAGAQSKAQIERAANDADAVFVLLPFAASCGLEPS